MTIMEPKYRVEYETTSEPEVFKTGMTKEECKEFINLLVKDGLNPNSIKVIRES